MQYEISALLYTQTFPQEVSRHSVYLEHALNWQFAVVIIPFSIKCSIRNHLL